MIESFYTEYNYSTKTLKIGRYPDSYRELVFQIHRLAPFKTKIRLI